MEHSGLDKEVPYDGEYNMKCKWMYEQIANCRYQIDVLTKLRDKLLPLLMNGQALVNYHLSAC